MDAQKLSESRDFIKASEALERAIRESPGYAEARVNLGAHYVRLGRFEEAVTQLERGLEIAGPSALLLCNLAAAQIRMGRIAEAMGSARWALRLDARYLQARLILGAILAKDTRDTRFKEEAIQHLEQAAAQYHEARRLLDRLRQ